VQQKPNVVVLLFYLWLVFKILFFLYVAEFQKKK